MDLNQMKEFVKKKHGNQKRIQGTLYYLHPFAVADMLAKKGYDLIIKLSVYFMTCLKLQILHIKKY